MKINKPSIIILVGWSIMVGVLVYLVTDKLRPEPPVIIDYHVVDSISAINRTLEDSIHSLSLRIKDAEKQKVKYKRVYDTVEIYTNPHKIVESLRIIANTPPK